ncbi:MAG: putative toxin-antitoxin system toxin component, PIN family [Elusimicrobiota bacterium]
MKVVLDTNILVSGLLSPFGAPAEIVRMAASGTLELCYDARILSEYRSVLLRPKFFFDQVHVGDILDQIKTCGHIVAAKPLPKKLPDLDDESFLEVALSGKARCLVTGNLKHYPVEKRQGMLVLSPTEFLEAYRGKL